MSLKAFHIFFITVSVLFSLWFGVWAIRDFLATDNAGTLVLGVISLLASGVLLVYGRWFLQKLKGESYL